MSKNLVQKVINSFSGTWTAPAGVKEITVTIIDNFNELIVAGQQGSLFLKSSGSAWGTGTPPTLGDGTNSLKSSPVPVIGGHSFVDITSNGLASQALKADGSVWAWGQNSFGELGDNTTIPKSSPIAVIGGHSFVKISAAQQRVLALKSDGSVWAWGENASGELGDDTTTPKSSPIAVIGGHSFINVSGGGNTCSAALKSDGSVWTWGENNSGQLGNGTSGTLARRSSPVAVIGGHSFVDISAGNLHLLALKADGSAWGWGNNATHGQLGIGNTTSRSSPVPVIGGHSFVKINTGGIYSLALKSDGSAWAWGQNSSGQLGDGTVISKSSPVPVIGGHSFINVSAGVSHSLGLKSDGSVWAWGSNDSGELGDGSITPRSSPVAVIGGHIFQAGSKLLKKYSFKVTPGQTYVINSLLTNINNSIILDSLVRNNVIIILEYYA